MGNRNTGGRKAGNAAEMAKGAKTVKAAKAVKVVRAAKAAAVLAVIAVLATGCQGGSKEKYTFRETGISQLDAGSYEEAIQSFDQALEKSSKLVGNFEIDVLKYRAEAEIGARDFDAAIHTYEVLCQVDEELPEYLYRSSLLHTVTGDYDKALEEYQKAYEKKPQAPEATDTMLSLGQGLTDAGRFDEAIELYQNAMNAGVQSGELYNRMGLCELDAGQLDQALEYLEKGLQTGDTDARAKLLYNQAAVYEKKLEFSKALTILETYEKEFGTTPEVEKEIAFLKTR